MDSPFAIGEVIDEGVAAGSLDWFIFLKKGFFVSAPWDDEEETDADGGSRVGAEGGDCTGTGRGLVGGSEAVGVAIASGESSDGWVLPSLEST